MQWERPRDIERLETSDVNLQVVHLGVRGVPEPLLESPEQVDPVAEPGQAVNLSQALDQVGRHPQVLAVRLQDGLGQLDDLGPLHAGLTLLPLPVPNALGVILDPLGVLYVPFMVLH